MNIDYPKCTENNYGYAKEIYGQFGIDTDKVLKDMEDIHISLQCWQGDDVAGFEGYGKLAAGGMVATGNYPGRARNGDELRRDLEKALSLIPGKHRVNLHAMYAEIEGEKAGNPGKAGIADRVDRDELTAAHFQKWISWARDKGLGLDFNPTFFAHEKAGSGLTLSSKDKGIRDFWIRHGQRCREISAEMGKALGTASVCDVWIPDGFKDIPADRLSYREILKASLDRIFEKKYDKSHLVDAVEGKLFGIGSEAFVVGSHEFYMGYALTNDVILCLDTGHFHPTETVADKISALLVYKDEMLLHVSRGIRWDSDHVVILNDDLLAVAHELKRCGAYRKVHLALDYFDASINRITAWVTGTRALLKAILISMLEPVPMLVKEEEDGNYGNRLALMEEFKSLPFIAVWNRYCGRNDAPIGADWLDSIKEYEVKVLSRRS